MSCPSNWTLFQNSCYFFNTIFLTWANSLLWCQAQKPTLVDISTQPEYNFIQSKTLNEICHRFKLFSNFLHLKKIFLIKVYSQNMLLQVYGYFYYKKSTHLFYSNPSRSALILFHIWSFNGLTIPNFIKIAHGGAHVNRLSF